MFTTDDQVHNVPMAAHGSGKILLPPSHIYTYTIVLRCSSTYREAKEEMGQNLLPKAFDAATQSSIGRSTCEVSVEFVLNVV